MPKAVEPTEKLKNQLSSLPDCPGVYLFKDESGEIIYIGKALSLRSRVRSYWIANSWLGRPKLAVLVPKICLIDTILTNSEKEALLLEATLIRKHLPRYNVALKDDKRYPWLAITYDEAFPRLIMIRDPVPFKRENPKARVFGPYVEAGAMWETVKVLRKVFPMRQRRKPLFKDRPCMNYHIGLCLGPCQNLVQEDFYNNMVQQVELFLSGSQKEALNHIQRAMEAASVSMRFEEAAKMRDRLFALKSVLERQQVFFKDQRVSQDIFAEAHSEKYTAICLMRVREGKLIASDIFDFDLENKTTHEEVFESFIKQYYAECEGLSVPKEVLIQHEIEDQEVLMQLLKEKSGHALKIILPSRGDKLKIVEMAQKNASLSLEKRLKDEEGANAQVIQVLTKLQEELALSKLPRKIVCFDISNIQGTDNVASMVVFENGQAKKSEYRRFKIKSVEGEANDFASMKEAVSRRFSRLQAESRPFPDLVIIDGGKGQLGAALEALKELGITELDILGLAKKQEELYKPNESRPLLLSRRSEALFLLQRVRDEAHRFAITFHRKLRAKRSLSSGFDKLPGVGAARRAALIKHFISYERLELAPIDEIRSVSGMSAKVAEKIYEYLRESTERNEGQD